MSLVEWTEPQDNDFGVDHLGMRVAGERAYSALIDFTTTVTWRPRYLSYLCWSLRKAWRDCGGTPSMERVEVDRRLWRRMLKRRDFILAGATLSVDRRADHIAGSRKLNKALDAMGHDPEAALTVATDHLVASTGSHAIYLGILRVLGLVVSTQGIDIPSPKGEVLAEAFEASLSRSEIASTFDRDTVVRGALEKLGEVCGLSHLPSAADAMPQAAAERHKLREQIVA